MSTLLVSLFRRAGALCSISAAPLQWLPPHAKAALSFFVVSRISAPAQVVTRMGGMPAF
jgi:hypothetical protein